MSGPFALLVPVAAAVCAGLAVASPVDTPTQPARVPLRTWTAEQTVRALLPVGGRVYLGGDFEAVGPPAGPLLVFRARDGSIDRRFPQIGGDIDAVEPDGEGRWFIGGDFTYVGGVDCPRLAHVRADGAVDRGWCPRPSDTVEVLARAGRTLYLAGSFDRIGAVSRIQLAAVDRCRAGRRTGSRMWPTARSRCSRWPGRVSSSVDSSARSAIDT
jgi:Domain of unknown function (DUF5122) beta-propeller